MGKTITKLGLMCLAQGTTLYRRCQALYHDSKSQLLNPENKLLYDMKTNPAAILSQ